MSFSATVENNTIKLPPGVELPDGTTVQVETSSSLHPQGTLERRFAERYTKYIGIADDLPGDFALNHDHYLHGSAKRPWVLLCRQFPLLCVVEPTRRQPQPSEGIYE